jgi:hypothetical protein
MSSLDFKGLGHLAPDVERINEQTEKIEEALPYHTYGELGALKHKPQIEDFVFFAAAQRAAEREQDGIT